MSAVRFYWKMSRYRCVGPGIITRAPFGERVQWTWEWWRKERVAMRHYRSAM